MANYLMNLHSPPFARAVATGSNFLLHRDRVDRTNHRDDEVQVNIYSSAFDLGYSFIGVKRMALCYIAPPLYHPYLVSIVSGKPSLDCSPLLY